MLVRIGITGHMDLTAATQGLVVSALQAVVTPYTEADLTGVSCLAPGADTLFARIVLDLGGRLEVIQPSPDYRTALEPRDATVFDALLGKADSVRVLEGYSAQPDAYAAANELLLSSCERLVAVWDGGEAADGGGTAAVVRRAREKQMPVVVVWPEGAERSGLT